MTDKPSDDKPSDDKPSDDQNRLIGRTIDNGRYEIVRLIGEGGMGRVYEARQVSMDRRVALKILRAQLTTDEQLLARFQQEALSISRLRHPNTITIFDYGKTEGNLLFMSMELLGGQSLFNILRQEGRLPLPRALRIMDQVAGAVAEAHQLGIVHRDLKPENIQIDHVGNDPDFAKVLDFGIAKILGGDGRNSEGKALTLAGSIFGTPHYMSPEQVHGHKVDHRTDLYSLGVILYEMLAGKPPFDGNTPMAVMMAQASKPLPDMREHVPEAQVNDAVLQLIADCCVKDRAKRLRTADDLLNRLRQIRMDGLGAPSGNWNAARPTESYGHGAPFENRSRVQTAPVPPPGSARRDSGQITPDHAGHIATVPPDTMYRQTDPNIRPLAARRGPSWWVFGVAAVAAVVVAVAIVLVAMPGQQDEDGSDDAAGKQVIQAQSIRYKIDSAPQGATVFVDGVHKGQTPFEFDRLRGEAIDLSVQLDGYQDVAHMLSGQGAPIQTVRLALERVEPPPAPTPPADPVPPPTAWLEIESQPTGAKVKRGDAVLGTTPFTWEPELEDGPITLDFQRDGYHNASHQLTLGERGDAPVKLTKKLRRKRRSVPNTRPRPDKPPRDKPRDTKAGPYEKL